jgi:hypothetical protein
MPGPRPVCEASRRDASSLENAACVPIAPDGGGRPMQLETTPEERALLTDPALRRPVWTPTIAGQRARPRMGRTMRPAGSGRTECPIRSHSRERSARSRPISGWLCAARAARPCARGVQVGDRRALRWSRRRRPAWRGDHVTDARAQRAGHHLSAECEQALRELPPPPPMLNGMSAPADGGRGAVAGGRVASAHTR